MLRGGGAAGLSSENGVPLGGGCSNVSRGRLIRERRGLRCRGPGPGPEQQRPGAKRRGRPGPAQGPACVEINRCFGCTDNSSRSHFSAMAWPRWLRRAVRNRHGHAIEQASRRWRERRRGDSGRTRRKFDFHTGSSRPATAIEREWGSGGAGGAAGQAPA